MQKDTRSINNDSSVTQPKPSNEIKKPGMLHLMATVFAAAFGVQSKSNLEVDFNQKSIVPYILAGIVFTLIFLLTLITIVSFVV